MSSSSHLRGLTDLKNVRRGKYVSNAARDIYLAKAIVFDLCCSDEFLESSSRTDRSEKRKTAGPPAVSM